MKELKSEKWYTYTYKYTHTYTHKYMYTDTCKHMYTHEYKYMYECMYKHVYINRPTIGRGRTPQSGKAEQKKKTVAEG